MGAVGPSLAVGSARQGGIPRRVQRSIGQKPMVARDQGHVRSAQSREAAMTLRNRRAPRRSANPGDRFVHALGVAGFAMSLLATCGGIVVCFFVFSMLRDFDTREMADAAFQAGGPAVRMIPMIFAREIVVAMFAVCL